MVSPVGEFLKRVINFFNVLYFSYLPRSPPWTDFHQILHRSISHDIITHAKLFGDWFRSVDSVGGRKWRVPID